MCQIQKIDHYIKSLSNMVEDKIDLQLWARTTVAET